MGILDRFRREEHVHFERDQAGKVTDVSREHIGRGSRTPVSDRLLGQQREESRERKQEYRQAYQEAFHKSRIKREAGRGSRAGSMTLGDRVDRIAGPPSSSRKSYSPRNNYNPIGSMFDTGMSRPKKKKSKTKYKVIGGKAYPIAGTGKKRKKTSKKKTSKSYDPFNAFGGYKF